MRGRKKGTKVGKYFKTCFFSSNPLMSNSPKQIEAKEYAYPFALEYKNINDYLTDYQITSDLFLFLDENNVPTIDGRLAYKFSKGIQNNNAKGLCQRCKETQAEFYPNCNYREFVALENRISTSIREITENKSYYCSDCNITNYASVCRKISSEVELQDVRLLSRPTRLTVKRERIKCAWCGRLLGDQQIIGFQAYCDGKMTCRLAENVLYAQLSTVKRENIAEAYGISKSQIDRIRARMLEQSLKARSYHVHSVIDQCSALPVVLKEIKDTRSGHVYYFYFLYRSKKDVVLINALTQADRDALPLLHKNPKKFLKHFPDRSAFYLACFCSLAGERSLRGAKLIEKLHQLDRLYDSFSPENKATYQIRALSFLDSNTNMLELITLLRRERRSRKLDTPQSSGQNVLPEFTAPGMDLISDESNEIELFLSSLKSVLQRNSTPARLVKESLLLLNPAMITAIEIDLLSGKRNQDHDLHVLRTEGVYMIQAPFGAPLQCLIHFLQNGLLDPDTNKLLRCALIDGIDDTEDGEKLTPCGLCKEFCPHLRAK